MRSQLVYGWVLGASFVIVAAGGDSVWGQSGSRTYPPAGSRTSQRATPATRPATPAGPVALEGYCPVSIVTMHKWVRGNPAYQVAYDGHTYLLASPQGKQMFAAHPEKYVPVLGGDCVVALKNMGRRVPGNIRTAAFHKDRLFLFANEQAKQMFLKQPSAYADVDLAYGGRCVVCQAMMGKPMPGKPELTSVYNGMRYQFASVDQQREFVANPAKYAVHLPANTPVGTGSTRSRPPAGGGLGSGSR